MATIILSSQTVPEDAQTGWPVGSLSISGGADGEVFTFTLDDERFRISENDGQPIIVVKEGVNFDFEAGSEPYIINVRAEGDRGTIVDDASFGIAVTDINEAPTDIMVAAEPIPDNADLGTVVAMLQADDPDEDQSFTYALVQDRAGTPLPEHESFEISDNQILVKGQLAVGSHSLWVKVTDSGSPALSYVKQITLTVTDANEPPDVAFEMREVIEGAGSDTTVGTLTATDPDGNPVEYSIVEIGADGVERPSTMFRIDANGNVVVLEGVKLLKKDGEDPTFTVKASDGTNTIYETFEVVLGENQEPIVNFESIEDLPKTIPGGTLIGTIVADDDENDTVSYTLMGGSKDLLRIDESGNVYVLNGFQLSYGTTTHRSFTVEWSDGINRRTESFNLHFVNEDPTVTLASQSILEGNSVNRVVGRVSAVDPECENLEYKLVGENAGLFELVKTSTSYDIVLRPGVVLDYETEDYQSLTVDIEVSDGTNTVLETLDIQLADVNEAPVLAFSARNVNEGVKGGTIIGRLNAADPEEGSVSYELSSSSERYFSLKENDDGSCDVVVRSGVTLDYETLGHRSFGISVFDGEHEVSGTFALNLLDSVDVVTGTQRKDTLRGQSGNDVIKGLGGDDLLIGNDGADTFYGGSGKDILTGGGGQDVFVFDSKPNARTNLDKVADFVAKDDAVWLDNRIFTKLGKTGSTADPAQLKKSFFLVGDKAKDANDYLIYNKKTGALSYDADGSGSQAAVQIATLSKKLSLTNKDFFVI